MSDEHRCGVCKTCRHVRDALKRAVKLEIAIRATIAHMGANWEVPATAWRESRVHLERELGGTT